MEINSCLQQFKHTDHQKAGHAKTDLCVLSIAYNIRLMQSDLCSQQLSRWWQSQGQKSNMLVGRQPSTRTDLYFAGLCRLYLNPFNHFFPTFETDLNFQADRIEHVSQGHIDSVEQLMSSSCPVSRTRSVALTPNCLSISPLYGIYHYVRAEHPNTLTLSCVVTHLNVLKDTITNLCQ